MTTTARFSKTGLTRMHNVMQGHIEQGLAPGAVTLAARGDEVHVDVIGALALDGGAPVQRDTIFRIASMTKPVIAVATMLLVEECKIRLDEPVDRLLPELASRQVLRAKDSSLEDTVPANRALTARDLLTFTAGYGMDFAAFGQSAVEQAMIKLELGHGMPDPTKTPAPDEWIGRLGTVPLMNQPGERWLYNTGSDILGVLIARAAGQPLDQFLRERIFEPLAMSDTGFFVPADKQPRFATSYLLNFETFALDEYDRPDGRWSTPPAFPSGAGGLVSTADDYLRFARMLMHNGVLDGARILSRPSVETMTTNQLLPSQTPDPATDRYWWSHGWGFGVEVVTRRDHLNTSPGRYGWSGGLGTTWANDPANDLIGIMLSQSAAPPEYSPVFTDFWTTLYAALAD